MDIREAILARLLVVAAVDGVSKVERNNDEINEQMRPAIVVFDGSEEANESDPRRRPATGPRIITMTPSIVALLGEPSETAGTSTNLLRAKLIKAICEDPALAGLTLNDEGIRYLGCETNLERGRSTEVEFGLFFAFTYVMRPDQLVEDVTA